MHATTRCAPDSCAIASCSSHTASRWRAAGVDYSGALTRFRVLREGEPWGEFETPLIGAANRPIPIVDYGHHPIAELF